MAADSFMLHLRGASFIHIGGIYTFKQLLSYALYSSDCAPYAGAG